MLMAVDVSTNKLFKRFLKAVSAHGRVKGSADLLQAITSRLNSEKNSSMDVDKTSDEVRSIIRRLIGCLASRRREVQAGAFITLRAAVCLHHHLQEVVMSELNSKFGMELKGEGDHAVLQAKVLCYGVLSFSGLVSSSNASLQEVIEQLCNLGKKHSCRLLSTQFLINIMDKGDSPEIYRKVWHLTQEDLKRLVFKLSPTELWLLLRLSKSQHPVQLDVPNTSVLLARKNFKNIGAVIKRIDKLDEGIHPLIPELIRSLSELETNSARSPLIDFWKMCVQPLMNESMEKQNLFYIFTKMIAPHVDPLEMCNKVYVVIMEDMIKSSNIKLFGHNSMEVLIMNDIKEFVIKHKNHGHISEAILCTYVLADGSINFDSQINIQFFYNTRVHFSEKSIKKAVSVLQETMCAGSAMEVTERLGLQIDISSINWLNSVDWLLKLIQYLPMKYQSTRAKVIATLLKKYIRFSSEEDDKNKEVQEELNSKIRRILDFTGRPLSEYALMLVKVVLKTEVLLKDDKLKILGEEHEGTWSCILEKLKEIQQCKVKHKDIHFVFMILYSYIALQYLLGSDIAADVVDDVNICLEKATGLCGEKTKEQEKEVLHSEEPQWVDVLVDVILLLLSKENRWKNLANAAFKLLLPLLSETAIMTVVDSLNPMKKPPVSLTADDLSETCREEISNGAEENEEEGDSISEDEEDEHSDDGDEDEDEELSAEDMQEDELQEGRFMKMKRDMMEAVGEGGEYMDVDIDSVPEEELFNFDRRIEVIGQKYWNQKKQLKMAAHQETVAVQQFRTRMCDLIRIFLQETPSLRLLLKVAPSLMEVALVGTRKIYMKKHGYITSQLQKIVSHHKIKKTIKNIKSGENNEAVSVNEVTQALNEVFSCGVKVPAVLTGLVQHLCNLVVRCGFLLLGSKAEEVDNPVVMAYKDILEKGLQMRSTGSSLEAFIGPLNFDNTGLASIAEMLIRYIFDTSTRPYQKRNAVKTLVHYYRNNKALVRVPSGRRKKLEKVINVHMNEMFDAAMSKESVEERQMSNLLEVLWAVKWFQETNKTEASGVNWEEVKSHLIAFCRKFHHHHMAKVSKPLRLLQRSLGIKVENDVQYPDGGLDAVSKGKKRSFSESGKGEVKETVQTDPEAEESDSAKEKNSRVTVKKKKKQKKSALMEQKARYLQNQVISELDNFSFANAAVDLQVEEPLSSTDAEVSDKMSKHRKKKARSKKLQDKAE